MTLGTRLRAARERAGLTQAQVGEALHVSRQYVHRLEAGDHEPTAGTLRALCLALGCSADSILGLPRPTRR